jgi:hypothetical protein
MFFNDQYRCCGLDAELLKAANPAALQLKINRSALIRAAPRS